MLKWCTLEKLQWCYVLSKNRFCEISAGKKFYKISTGKTQGNNFKRTFNLLYSCVIVGNTKTLQFESNLLGINLMVSPNYIRTTASMGIW